MAAEERLERLERRVEALEAQAQAAQQEVRSKHFALEDRKGRLRAVLEMSRLGPLG
jgi:phage shock protein A